MALGTRRGAFTGLVLAAALVFAGCGADDDAANHADRTFLARMIPHHERAIEVARLGVSQADDPRVRAFASRIISEQSPELRRMRADAKGLHLNPDASAALDRITDRQLTALKSLHGPAFDRQFLRLHISSETGAAQMADSEVDAGADHDAVDVARGIASAPHTEIPELRSLLHALGG